jgi:hypothetical protein
MWRTAAVCAMMPRMPSVWRLVPVLAVAAVLVGCAPAAEPPPAGGPAQCNKASLGTLYKGAGAGAKRVRRQPFRVLHHRPAQGRG